MAEEQTSVMDMTAEIVAAYVGNNSVSADQLPNLIQQVHGALKGAGDPASAPAAPATPAVPVRKSINPDYLICLEDGRRFKSLKRHLRTKYGISPEEYRAKWGLAKDYPMVAPNYAAARSQLAKSMGLGQGGRTPAKKPRANAR